ncbi:hypothetical protein [Micrococcus porci]|uniref:hypothetical protein n=1 Tax=Micrococcus porci TaxID=2856555 RepID=UPI003CF87F0F
MPQSTLYWIIGIIIVVLVIILIVSSLRAKRGREEEAAAAGRHTDSAPAPLAATAARGGTVGASTVPATGASEGADEDAARLTGQDSAVDGAARVHAESVTGDAPAGRTGERAAGATALSSFDVVEVDRRAAEQREQNVVERRRATGAEAGAAGHAAVPGVAGGSGGSGVSVDEAEGVAKDATAQDVTPVADAQRRNGSSAAPAATGEGLGLAAAGVAGGTGVTVDDAGTGADLPAPKGSPAGVVEVAETQAEARTYPVTGLPGVPGAVDPEQVAAARVQDAAELKAAEGRGAEHERGASQPADPESVPGTVPLTGEEAVIEAPVHTHEMPEPVLGTPAYIQDSTTGQDPTEDLPEGQVYGTTPLSGEDAIVEPADQLRAETADRVEPAAPVAGTPARDEARTHDEHRSRLEIVKAAVAETAGTVATTAGTAAEKAAPVVRSAARTVGKAAGSTASTLKDKLAQAQQRRWGKR